MTAFKSRLKCRSKKEIANYFVSWKERYKMKDSAIDDHKIDVEEEAVTC